MLVFASASFDSELILCCPFLFQKKCALPSLPILYFLNSALAKTINVPIMGNFLWLAVIMKITSRILSSKESYIIKFANSECKTTSGMLLCAPSFCTLRTFLGTFWQIYQERNLNTRFVWDTNLSLMG